MSSCIDAPPWLIPIKERIQQEALKYVGGTKRPELELAIREMLHHAMLQELCCVKPKKSSKWVHVAVEYGSGFKQVAVFGLDVVQTLRAGKVFDLVSHNYVKSSKHFSLEEIEDQARAFYEGTVLSDD